MIQRLHDTSVFGEQSQLVQHCKDVASYSPSHQSCLLHRITCVAKNNMSQVTFNHAERIRYILSSVDLKMNGRLVQQKGFNLFPAAGGKAHTCGIEEQSTDYMRFIFSFLKGKPLVPCTVTPQRTLFPLAVCLLKQRSHSVTHQQRGLDAAEIPKKGKVAFIRFFYQMFFVRLSKKNIILRQCVFTILTCLIYTNKCICMKKILSTP